MSIRWLVTIGSKIIRFFVAADYMSFRFFVSIGSMSSRLGVSQTLCHFRCPVSLDSLSSRSCVSIGAVVYRSCVAPTWCLIRLLVCLESLSLRSAVARSSVARSRVVRSDVGEPLKSLFNLGPFFGSVSGASRPLKYGSDGVRLGQTHQSTPLGLPHTHLTHFWVISDLLQYFEVTWFFKIWPFLTWSEIDEKRG